MIKSLYISLLALFLVVYSGSSNLYASDSLYISYKNTNIHDSLRFQAINSMVWEVMFSNPDSAIVLAKEQSTFAIEKYSKKEHAKALNNEGIANAIQGNADQAEKCYLHAIDLSEQIKDYKKVASIYNNLGILYKEKNSLPKSIEYFFKSLKTHEKNNDKLYIASTLNNIGTVYYLQRDYKKAELHFQKSLDIAEEIDDKNSQANALQNIAIIRISEEKYSEAIELNRKVATIRMDLNQTQGIAEVYGNLGSCFLGLIPDNDSAESAIDNKHVHLLDSAFQYYNHGLKLARSIDARYEIADNLKGLGRIAYLKNDIEHAIEFYEESSQISTEFNFLEIAMGAHEGLYKCYKKYNNSDAALINFEKQIAIKDSLENEEDQKALIQKELQFDYDKQTLAKQKEQEKKDAVNQLILYSVIAGLALVVIFSLFLFNRFRVISKQKKLIEVQKKEVERQYEITEKQKHEIEEINIEITDSINYAEKIQSALLKSTDDINSQASAYFNLFKPKDIVSGDFYWGTVKDNYLYVACVDCTGHGVPGAFMSMLGMSFLNEILGKNENIESNQILDQLRSKIIKELNQTGGEGDNKDGMDLALYRLDYSNPENVKLQFSGANNSLFIIKSNDKDQNGIELAADKSHPYENCTLFEFKGDKQPISHYPGMKPFTKKEITLEKGDDLYMTSDGYPDQFGGPKNKKFMIKNLKSILAEINEKPFSEQSLILENKFITYQGAEQQIDDVCLIGIKV